MGCLCTIVLVGFALTMVNVDAANLLLLPEIDLNPGEAGAGAIGIVVWVIRPALDARAHQVLRHRRYAVVVEVAIGRAETNIGTRKLGCLQARKRLRGRAVWRGRIVVAPGEPSILGGRRTHQIARAAAVVVVERRFAPRVTRPRTSRSVGRRVVTENSRMRA